MRQVGVLAAAGLVALDRVDRLADDHARARRLAEAVAERWPGLGRPGAVQTNIVRFAVGRPGRACCATSPTRACWPCRAAPRVVRLVTHLDVDDADVERAVAAIASAPDAA